MQIRRQGSDSQSRRNLDSDETIPKNSHREKVGRNKNVSNVGMGLDDIINERDAQELSAIAPVEIELSSIIRDVEVGQVPENDYLDIYKSPRDLEDDFPAHDVDEPLSPSPRDTEPS